MDQEEKLTLGVLERYGEYLYGRYSRADDPEDRDIKYDEFSIVNDAAELLKELLTDRVRVVRCKDCAYGIPTKDGRGDDAIQCILSVEGMYYSPDWYCADGEER